MTRTAKAIDYSAPNLRVDGAAACQREIAAFVRGVRGPRSRPVTASQIKAWLAATPPDFVDRQIDAACLSGLIRIRQKSLSSGRRFNGCYVYEVA